MEFTKEQILLQTIVKKAWEDTVFKQKLITNPISVIENLTGERISIPEGKTIVVQDQTDASIIYLNIPVKPNMDNMELNEEQLEAVAGGWDLAFLSGFFSNFKFSNI
ncbi:NHLP leader peptide family RiPP precursor [Polaribacter sp. Q13]|uniref:NHLP leader peptide family RiPP precursor n=1 Tax=Polaribacter sp. Q13 TaxID=2806551 RepID=UPI00193C490D|nr:NHLP leader peptide family RiPP precursor [Polaribacter sp. Q13]QVY64633.1 NHLP leader peptide family RiPP precursor [Polaribacter sp. Q13]